MQKSWRTFRNHKYSFRGFNSTMAAFLRLPTVYTSDHVVSSKLCVCLKWCKFCIHFPQFLVWQRSLRSQDTPDDQWTTYSTAQMKLLRTAVNLSPSARNLHTFEDRFADRRRFKTWVTHIFTINSCQKKIFVLFYLHKQPCPLIVKLTGGGWQGWDL